VKGSLIGHVTGTLMVPCDEAKGPAQVRCAHMTEAVIRLAWAAYAGQQPSSASASHASCKARADAVVPGRERRFLPVV